MAPGENRALNPTYISAVLVCLLLSYSVAYSTVPANFKGPVNTMVDDLTTGERKACFDRRWKSNRIRINDNRH